MSIKSFFLAALLAASPLYASSVYKFNNQRLATNQLCEQVDTYEPFDLALINDGFFVVSRDKKNKEILFTRYARLYIDTDYFLRTDAGEYLLGINKKSDLNHLKRIKIPNEPLPPKATTRVELQLNLPAALPKDDISSIVYTIYDAIGESHVLEIVYTRTDLNTWNAQVSVDNIKLNKGTLTFNNKAKLVKQEGLSHIQWPTTYGLMDLKLDHSGSTAYASPLRVESANSNGYPLGQFMVASVAFDGAIYLVYYNGQTKLLSYSVAVAKFNAPSSLDLVAPYLYKPTEKSGLPMIHRKNSDGAVISGALEKEACF